MKDCEYDSPHRDRAILTSGDVRIPGCEWWLNNVNHFISNFYFHYCLYRLSFVAKLDNFAIIKKKCHMIFKNTQKTVTQGVNHCSLSGQTGLSGCAHPLLHRSSLFGGPSVPSVLKPHLAMVPSTATLVTPTGHCRCVWCRRLRSAGGLKSAENLFEHPHERRPPDESPLPSWEKRADGEELDCAAERCLSAGFRSSQVKIVLCGLLEII